MLEESERSGIGAEDQRVEETNSLGLGESDHLLEQELADSLPLRPVGDDDRHLSIGVPVAVTDRPADAEQLAVVVARDACQVVVAVGADEVGHLAVGELRVRPVIAQADGLRGEPAVEAQQPVGVARVDRADEWQDHAAIVA